MQPSLRVLVLILATAAACTPTHVAPMDGAPGSDGDTDGPNGPSDARPDAYDGELAVLTGRVWAPNSGPGLALAGEEIPIFDAAVYLTPRRPQGIPPGVYCERCTALPTNVARSAHDGSFQVRAAPGTYWLVIEKAQFRLEQEVTIEAGERVLEPGETTLPSTHDPENGQWIPSIAIAVGTHDWIEDVLGKIRLGSVDSDNRFTATNGDLDVYDNGSPTVDVRGTGHSLISSLDKMRRYHIIFLSCSAETLTDLSDPIIRENLRRYVEEGGKLYVTDYLGEVIDAAFPPQITFGDFRADTTGTYDPAEPSIDDITFFGRTQGINYSSRDAVAVDRDLNQWLGLQAGPTALDPSTQPYTPDDLDIIGNWNWIRDLTPVKLGVDSEGEDVFDVPKVWVEGSGAENASITKYPLSVTFEPTGCGRVMYSTYHTNGGVHPGLSSQERILLYLIFELGTCQAGPIVE